MGRGQGAPLEAFFEDEHRVVPRAAIAGGCSGAPLPGLEPDGDAALALALRLAAEFAKEPRKRSPLTAQMDDAQTLLVRLDEGDRVGARDQAPAHADRLHQVGACDPAFDPPLVDERVGPADEAPEAIDLVARRALGRIDGARRGDEEGAPRDLPETVPARQAADGDVLARRVEPRDARAEPARACDPVGEQGGGDTAAAVRRVHPQRVQPRLPVADEAELGHPDDSAVDECDPKPSPSIADPVVEHVEHVVVSPDLRADAPHRALVRRAGRPDLDQSPPTAATMSGSPVGRSTPAASSSVTAATSPGRARTSRRRLTVPARAGAIPARAGTPPRMIQAS